MLATVPRILELLRDKVARDEASRSPRLSLADRIDRSARQHWLRRWWTFRHVRRRFGWKFWAFLSEGRRSTPAPKISGRGWVTR